MKDLKLKSNHIHAGSKTTVQRVYSLALISGLAIVWLLPAVAAPTLGRYEQRLSNCRLFSEVNGQFDVDAYNQCIAPHVRINQEILDCPTSPKRHDEAVAYDKKLFRAMFSDYGEVEVPKKIRQTFDQLVAATMLNFKFPLQPPTWTLQAYRGKAPNAHSGAGGSVVLSDSLWTGNDKLTNEEIGGFLAHEIAHVVLNHSLKLGCLALDWVREDFSIKEATETFRDDFDSPNPRRQAWTSTSQSFEYEADQLALQILGLAKMDPQSMAAALAKLVPKNRGGFTSGSHPDIEDRIRAVTK